MCAGRVAREPGENRLTDRTTNRKALLIHRQFCLPFLDEVASFNAREQVSKSQRVFGNVATVDGIFRFVRAGSDSSSNDESITRDRQFFYEASFPRQLILNIFSVPLRFATIYGRVCSLLVVSTCAGVSVIDISY